jgi:thioredoxin-related protein
MTREVYTDKKFIEFSRSQIFLRVFQDTEAEGERLARKFKIRGFPTLIVLDSDGQEIDRIPGAMSAPDLIEELKQIFESAKSDTRITL